MKKVLSLVLAGSMILSSMSMAFAATPAPALTDIAGTEYEDAVKTLVALDIVDGYEDGTFKATRTVTRAEMAKMLVVTLGYGDLVAGSKSNFSDTKGHWADSYVALAAGKGIVIGTGNGTFTPDRQVSYDEAITMVVRALGYTDASSELKGMSWPTNFKVKAAELDLTDDVAMNSTGADRGGVAQLIYNALEAKLVSITSEGDVVVSGNKLLSRLAKFDDNFSVTTDKVNPDNKNYAGDKVDLTPYMYQNLDVYTIDGDVVYVDDVNSVTLTGKVTAVTTGSGATITIEDSNEDEYTVNTSNAGINLYYNGDEIANVTGSDFDNYLYDGKSTAYVTVVGIDTDNDDKVDNGEYVTAAVVEKATLATLITEDYISGKTKLVGNPNVSLPTDDGKADLDKITVTGAVDSLEDIAEDDVVVAYAANDNTTDEVKLVVVRDAVEGKVTKTNSDSSKVYIDGKSYDVSKIANTVGKNAINVGDNGVFYLDNAGKVFATDTTGTQPTDYAYVLDTAAGLGDVALGGSVDKYPQIKLLTQDGNTVTYKVAVDVEVNAGAIVVKGADSADYITANGTTTSELLTGSALAINFTQNTKSQVVKYSLDDNGYIDSIKAVTTDSQLIYTADIDTLVADGAIVFSTDGKDVVSVDTLKDKTSYTVVFNKDGKIEVVIATDATLESSNDEIYGVITAVNIVENEDGNKVQEITALVNGEKVVYLANEGVTLSKTTADNALLFSFNTNDELLTANPIAATTTTAVYTGTLLDSSSTKVNVSGSGIKYLADDCVVYVYDLSDAAMTAVDVADLIDGRNVSVYSTSADESSKINIIVQIQQ